MSMTAALKGSALTWEQEAAKHPQIAKALDYLAKLDKVGETKSVYAPRANRVAKNLRNAIELTLGAEYPVLNGDSSHLTEVAYFCREWKYAIEGMVR